MKTKKIAFMAIAFAAAGWCAWRFYPRTAPSPAVQFEARGRAVPALADFAGSSNPHLAFTTSDALDVLAAAGPPGKERLEFTQSRDGGDSFSAAVTVSLAGASVMARGEMSPEIQAKGDNVFVLWQQSVGTARSQIVFARSTDSGKSFQASVAMVRQPKDGSGFFSGFANLSVSPRGDLYAVWLDGRDPKRTTGTFDVYLKRSADHGATWGAGMRVAAQSCPCCRPAVAADDRGNVYVAFRKVYAGSQRDLAVAVSHDGGRSFAPPLRIADEGWTLHACPETGPALAVRDGQVVAAWFTGAGTPGVRVAVSTDGAKSFHVTPIGGIADENHPTLSLSEDGALWLGLQGRAVTKGTVWPPLQAFAVRVQNNGELSAPVAIPGPPISGYPAVAAASGGRLFVANGIQAGGGENVSLIRGRAAGSIGP